MDEAKHKEFTASKTKQLRRDSGSISSKDPLVSFLYSLMRDHLATGEVEKLVLECEEYADQEILYTNGWLAQYATNLANRLRAAFGEKQ